MLTGQARFKEIMASPVSRYEADQMEQRLLMNVASCAAGIEALEAILIRQNILKKDELMAAVESLLENKAEQAQAAAATESQIIKAV